MSTLASIISYVSTLDGGTLPGSSSLVVNLDAFLTPVESSKRTAWKAYLDSKVADLVAHDLFSSGDNYQVLIKGEIGSTLGIPQRYYVPGRLRSQYRFRLESDDTDGLDSTAKTDNSREDQQAFKRAFAQEKHAEAACECFEILHRLLEDRSFIFQNRPTSLDVLIASYTLLLLKPPVSDPRLRNLLLNSYPALVTHASLIFSLAFPDAAMSSIPSPKTTHQRTNPLLLVTASATHLSRQFGQTIDSQALSQPIKFILFTLAGFGMARYLLPLTLLLFRKGTARSKSVAA